MLSNEQSERLEFLRLKLDDGIITVEELREFCFLNFPPREGMHIMPIEHFIPDDTIVAFDWLCNWWILPEYPKHLPKPSLLAFLWAIYIPLDTQGVPITTKFMEFVAKGRAYCEANGLNPDQPMSNDDTLRKARNRTRMARARAARKVPDRELPDPAIKGKVRLLEANIQKIKEQAKAEDIRCRDNVVKYQQLMVEAATERKAVAQQHRDAIDAVRIQITNLTQ
jgi:hypothetical protein